MANRVESRTAAALRRCATEVAREDDDDGLAEWCVSQGLNRDGTPLDGMAAARWAQEKMLEDELRQAQQPQIPFWRLPFAHDL